MPKSLPFGQPVEAVLFRNIRAYRALRGLDQAELAERMAEPFGLPWHQSTVSAVERGARTVTVPELLALVVALGATVEQLLDPRGPERRVGPELHLSKALGDRIAVDPADVTGLVCSHAVDLAVDWRDDAVPDWRHDTPRDLHPHISFTHKGATE